MRISRLHTDASLAEQGRVELDADSSHYLAKVLRLRQGDPVNLFNARDGEFSGSIDDVQRKQVSVTLQQCVKIPCGKSLELNLGLGLSRGDRMDFAIQKSTELGVSSLTPLYTQHGEVRIKQADRLENKLRHWQKVAVSASEQCGRLDIPTIHTPCPVDEWIGQSSADLKLLLEPGGDTTLGGGDGVSVIDLLIGPEGGFAKQELDLARAKSFSIVTLGPRVLRTETAPVATLAILQHLYGDF